jgi:CheY-like chemotaxis protein
MSRVLLVDAETDSCRSLQRALVGAGYDVVVATSGRSALAALEADWPAAVVTQGRLGDMDGRELFTRTRSAPATAHIPFLLFSGVEADVASAASAAGVDMVCAGHVSVNAFVERLGHLVAGDVVVGDGEPAPRPARGPAAGRDFQGSLGVMDLPAVTQAIAHSGKTGRLEVFLASGNGCLDFEVGKLVHAEFGSDAGEKAFAAVIRASQAQDGGQFGFMAGDAEWAAGLQHTINRGLDRLLLSTAAGIDEGEAAPTIIPAGVPGSTGAR